MSDLATAAADLAAAAQRFNGLLPEAPFLGIGTTEGSALAEREAYVGKDFTVYVRSVQGHLLVTVNQTVAGVLGGGPAEAASAPTWAEGDNVEPDLDLFDGPRVLAILLAFVLGWTLLHFLMPLPSQGKLTGPRLVYWRRLLRSQLYYIAAAIAGPFLLSGYASPYQLLYRFTRQHQVLFAMGIAHWVVASVEDTWAASLLAQGLERMPQLGNTAKSFIFQAYFVHHVVTIGIIAFSLSTQTLSSLPVLGFVFEIPVVFMNVREFVYTFWDFLGFARWTPRRVIRHRNITFTLFVLARGGPSLLWVWSLLYWGPVLATLPEAAWYVYNTTALFFTVLNFFLLNLLEFWFREDLADSTAADKRGGPEASLEECRSGQKEFDSAEAPPAPQAMAGAGAARRGGGCARGPPASAAAPDRGQAPPAPQGIGGDGGESGGDAARHGKEDAAKTSKKDDALMKLKLARGYRMFSYYDEDHENLILTALLRLISFSVVARWTCTSTWGLANLNTGLQQRVAICACVLICAALNSLLQALQEKLLPQALARCASPLVHASALCLIVMLVSFLECIQHSPPQLLNGAALALFIQQVLTSQGWVAVEHWLLVPVTCWLYSWHWSCAAFGASLLGLCHAMGHASGEVATTAIIIVAGFYSALAIPSSWHTIVDLAATRIGLLGVIPTGWQFVLAVAFLGQLFLIWFQIVWSCTRLMNPAMTVRSVCFLVASGHAGELLVLAPGLLQARRLKVELRRAVDVPGCAFRLLVVQEAFDITMSLALAGLWRFLSCILEGAFNAILPGDMQVYVFPTTFPRTGPRVALGLCTYVPGPRDLEPTSFVCNVGHIDERHDGCYGDLTRTSRSAVGIVREFDAADKEQIGLAANILCLIPVKNEAGVSKRPYLKEFNFSAWASHKHAFEWYLKSPEHKEILREHKNGDLKTFGNVLASLQASRPIRWQARCPECAALVNGYPEVRICECGAPVIDMPLF